MQFIAAKGTALLCVAQTTIDRWTHRSSAFRLSLNGTIANRISDMIESRENRPQEVNYAIRMNGGLTDQLDNRP